MGVSMKVLWLCNMALPMAARQMNLEVPHKEGWLSGIAEAVLKRQKENGIRLSVAFPMPGAALQKAVPAGGGRSADIGTASSDAASAALKTQLEQEGFCEKEITWEGSSFSCYGFREDTIHAEKYDPSLEQILQKIVYRVKPDLVHCFGTEYPHTLAMCRIFPEKSRLLVGLQGLCTLYAEGYFADLPEDVIRSVTFRDWLKKDTLKRQQEKFILRGRSEREALSLAGNVTGRTEWDRTFAERWSPAADYYPMNETLRKEFYGPEWDEEKCEPHSIFLSQGDYPLKGLHYMLAAVPRILARYPDAKVYVAGNSLVEFHSIKQKLKLSAYGRYLRGLLGRLQIQEKVEFLGKLDAEQMRDRYLKSGLFVCCSALENSPNSLGEAMLLGMPCVSAAVGGIPSIFTGGQDGILYEGFEMPSEAEYRDASLRTTVREGEASPGACRKKGEGKAEMASGGDRGKSQAVEPKGAEETAPGGDRGKSQAVEPKGAEETASGGVNEKGMPKDQRLEAVAERLADAVIEMWSDPEKRKRCCANAREHALRTHDRERNYRRITEIYEQIVENSHGVQLY